MGFSELNDNTIIRTTVVGELTFEGERGHRYKIEPLKSRLKLLQQCGTYTLSPFPFSIPTATFPLSLTLFLPKRMRLRSIYRHDAVVR